MLSNPPIFLTYFSLLVAGVALLVACVVFIKVYRIGKGVEVIRLTNMGSVVSDQPASAPDEKIITLSDNEGTMKLSVRQRNIFFIESDDNYIKVWYEDHSGAVRQYMLRCRLKTVEASFSGSDLIRCHRKYIINISKVQVLSKKKDGYLIELDGDMFPDIPVSKTYESAVLARFNSR